jgi:hypothetical protein
MRLIPPTREQWLAARRWEAVERGYHTTVENSDTVTTMFFWNGPYCCYSKQWREGDAQPDSVRREL